MNKKKVLLVILLAIVVFVSAWFIIKGITKTDETDQDSNLAAVEAVPGSVSIKVEGPAVIEPYQTRDIRSAIEGSVVLVAGEGDSIDVGEILSVLMGVIKKDLCNKPV